MKLLYKLGNKKRGGKMTTIEKSFIIKAPFEKVFNFTANMSNLKNYFVYVNKVKPLDRDIIQKGSRYSLKVKFLGSLRDSEWECIEYDDKSGWKINATLMGVTAVKQWKFDQDLDTAFSRNRREKSSFFNSL